MYIVFSVHLVPSIVKNSLSLSLPYICMCVYMFIGVLIDQSNFSNAFYWIVESSSYAFLVFVFWAASTPMIYLLLHAGSSEGEEYMWSAQISVLRIQADPKSFGTKALLLLLIVLKIWYLLSLFFCGAVDLVVWRLLKWGVAISQALYLCPIKQVMILSI